MTASPARLLLRFLIPLLLVTLAVCPRAYAAGEGRLSTKYFTIVYPSGEEKTASWYAGFVDDVDAAVSDLLGSAPVAGITLTIYASEAEYMGANPMAEIHPGILAHAIPEEKEVGVAVERLRQAPPELARESFRHEMTHVVAGALSNQDLPIGFQEGLAQYNELSATRGQEVARALLDAPGNGGFLSWNDLNDRRVFANRMEVAYPQSYSVMSFLAERYGMGAYSRFLEGLRDGHSWQDALQTAYSAPSEKLEVAWREYLPDFLKDGWKSNLLTAYDTAPAVALYNAGRFSEAADLFARSEKLYKDLGKSAKASDAASYRENATKARGAVDTLAQASTMLEEHNYGGASHAASTAETVFSILKLEANSKSASDVLAAAKRGSDAEISLRVLKGGGLHLLDYDQASEGARKAGAALAGLGDDARVADANAFIESMKSVRRAAGFGILSSGAAAALLGAAYSFVAHRRRRVVAPRNVEESASWL